MAKIECGKDHTGGPRLYLETKPIYAGDTLDVLLRDGQWLPVLFGWIDQVDGQATFFVFSLPLGNSLRDALLRFPEEASFRWPQSG